MNVKKSFLLFYHGTKLILNPDKSIKSLLFIGDTIAQSKASQVAVEQLLVDTSLRKMYNNKEGLQQLDFDILNSFGEDTFGKDVYNFYKNKGLDIFSIKNVENMSEEIYISERVRKTHDLLHVVLGYDTDLIGEAKVNAFIASQLRMPLSFLVLCGITIKFFFTKPLHFQMLIKEIVGAWKAGEDHQNLLTIEWDEKLHISTELVRNSFRFQRKPELHC